MMPMDEQLLAMEAVGARVEILGACWQATVIRRDEATGAIYGETWPLRSRFRCARADASRFAPQVIIGGFATLMCWLRWRNIEAGYQPESDEYISESYSEPSAVAE